MRPSRRHDGARPARQQEVTDRPKELRVLQVVAVHGQGEGIGRVGASGEGQFDPPTVSRGTTTVTVQFSPAGRIAATACSTVCRISVGMFRLRASANRTGMSSLSAACDRLAHG